MCTNNAIINCGTPCVFVRACVRACVYACDLFTIPLREKALNNKK